VQRYVRGGKHRSKRRKHLLTFSALGPTSRIAGSLAMRVARMFKLLSRSTGSITMTLDLCCGYVVLVTDHLMSIPSGLVLSGLNYCKRIG